MTDPGYVTPQGAASENYYYTARDAFRTESLRRTDIAVNYTLGLGTGARQLTPFVQIQVINLFNNQDLCACGSDVFTNSGGVALNRIGSGVLAPVAAARWRGSTRSRRRPCKASTGTTGRISGRRSIASHSPRRECSE